MTNKYSYIKIVTLNLNTWFHFSSNRRLILIFSLKGATRGLHVPPKLVLQNITYSTNHLTHEMLSCETTKIPPPPTHTTLNGNLSLFASSLFLIDQPLFMAALINHYLFHKWLFFLSNFHLIFSVDSKFEIYFPFKASKNILIGIATLMPF